MKLDLVPFEAWESLNLKLATQLNSSNDVRAYAGCAAAIYELAMSTAQFYSHKRSVGFIEGQTPHLASVLPYLYKEGYQIQFPPQPNGQPSAEHQPLDPKAWVESLKKDTNFVALCEDHPVTGELYNVDELDQLLNEKKIFVIRISHNNHLYNKIEVKPYTVRICSYHAKAAVAFLGAKFKSPPLMAQAMDWSEQEFLQAIQEFSQSKEDKAAIQKFESTLPKGYEAFLKTENRLYDRALIYCNDVTGEAVQQFLKKELNQPLLRAGMERDIETTHLCRWGGTIPHEHWWKPTPSAEILRGLLVISVNLIQKSNITALLEKSLKECRFEEL